MNEPTPPRWRILIVDDEPSFRELLRDALPGHETVEAGSADAALPLLEAGPAFDAVLLDLLMPGLPAKDVLGWIRARSPRTAVVIVSGHRTEETVISGLADGAVDFLSKPFRADELRIALSRAIRRQTSAPVDPGEIAVERPATGWVELTAPSAFEYLQRMQRFSDALFHTRLPREICEDLRIAVEEVGRNAIEWGNRLDPDKQVHISYCFFQDRIVLKFEDEGEGFRPDLVPDPSGDLYGHMRARASEGKRPGGFGVRLVQSIMDEVSYSERGNVVLMTRFLRE